MSVFEFILHSNISQALTRIESLMIRLCNSFELPIFNDFFKNIIYTATKPWTVKDLL